MSKPIVLIDSILLEAGTVIGLSNTGSAAGTAIDSVATPFTYDKWVASTADHAYIGITPAAPALVDCLCITGRLENIHRIVLRGVGSGPVTTLLTIAAPKSGAIMARFDNSTSYDEFVVIVYYKLGATVPISISNIMLGKAIEFERCIMKSHSPITFNRVTQYDTNESGTGNFLGRSIMRQNTVTDVEFSMMSAPWSRDTFQRFVKHAQRYPFYFSWNPSAYPDEAGYVWTDEDIGISYTGDAALMSASWKMKGISRYEE